MATIFLCDRPLSKFVDFETSRFVVATGVGLNIGGKHLEMGDEIPKGIVSADALRCEYEPPLSRIQLLEFALKDEVLLEACTRRGTLEAQTKPEIIIPNFEKLTRKELVLLCEEQHLPFHGSKTDLCQRLTSALV